jgi:cytoskeletal protein RodZ
MPRRYFLVPSGVDPLQYPIQQRKRDWMKIFWVALAIAAIISVWIALTGATAKEPEPTPTVAPTETQQPTNTPTNTALPTNTPTNSPTPTVVFIASNQVIQPSPTLPMLPTWTPTSIQPTAIPSTPLQTNKPQPTQTPWIVERVIPGGVTQVPVPVIQTRVVEIRSTVIVPVTVVVTATPTNTPAPTNTPTPTATIQPTIDYSQLIHVVFLPIVYHMIDPDPIMAYPAP